MAISGYNSVPLGVAGSGSAVILRGGDAALGILQQGQRARELRAQREALQRQKDALALSKQLSEDRRLGLDTGGAFQEPFNNSVAGVQDYFTDQYKQLQAGQISQLQLSQNIANKKNEVERERLLGVDKDKLIAGYETAQSANKYRDKEGLHTALGETLLGADGSRVRASQYDERGTLQKLDADARTYNPEPIIADYFAKQQASTLEDAAAGRIGGLHSSSSVTYKGYTPVRRADGQWDVKRGANGLPELKTTEAELATERSRNHELNMAVSRLELEEGKAAKAEGRPPRAAIDLYRQAAGKYASFRQNESVGLNAQPRAGRAGAGTKFTTNDPNAGGFANYGISTNRDNGSTAGAATIFQGEAPTRISSTGKVDAYTRDNAVFNEYVVQQPGKSAELVKNNTRPQNLQFESILHVLRTPTGNIVRPTQAADTKDAAAYEAWYKRAKAENPKANGEWVVQATPKKGDNQLSSEDEVFDELQAANRRASTRKSEPELRAQARKLVGEQNAVYYIPYTGDNARRLNAYTDNFYEKGRASRQKVVDDFERRSTPAVTGPASLIQGPAAPRQSSPPAQPSGASRFRKTR